MKSLLLDILKILGMENTQENLNEAEPKLPNVKHNQHYFIAYKWYFDSVIYSSGIRAYAFFTICSDW